MKQTLKILKRVYHQQQQKPRKSKQIDVNSEQETSDTSKSSETEHLSAFEDMISD